MRSHLFAMALLGACAAAPELRATRSVRRNGDELVFFDAADAPIARFALDPPTGAH